MKPLSIARSTVADLVDVVGFLTLGLAHQSRDGWVPGGLTLSAPAPAPA